MIIYLTSDCQNPLKDTRDNDLEWNETYVVGVELSISFLITF